MGIQEISTVVSVEWLKENLERPNLVLLDATLPKATDSAANETKTYIPGARIFDIKNVFSDTGAEFPNTMVSEKIFEKEAQKLGINRDSTIVVYDAYGIYSSARAWYMFKSMGHKNVAVLNGGLPAWKARGFPTEETPDNKVTKGNFKARYNEKFFKDYTYLLKNLTATDKSILDARSADRFKGQAAEPRPGLRKGHIPNSENIPYEQLLENGILKDKRALQTFFDDYKNKNELIFSCGSGITACILALGAEISGIKNYSVYDGSWTEWGSLGQLPLERD